MRYHLMALAITVSSVIAPAQGCYESSNSALRNYQSAAGSAQWQNDICQGNSCHWSHDCFVPTPLVRLQGGLQINNYVTFYGRHEQLARVPSGQTDPCGTDLPLACTTPVWLGVVGFSNVDTTLGTDVTHTVPCRVRVDESSFYMPSVTYVEGGSEFAGPSFHIPNDPSWIGATLYWQGFEFFDVGGVTYMMGSQMTYFTVTA